MLADTASRAGNPASQPDAYTPQDIRHDPGATDGNRDVVQECADRLAEAFQFDRHNREDAIVDLKFLAGDQWPEYARAARVNRPMLTINKLPQFLFQITNDIRRNSASLKVTPVDGGQDPGLAQIYDGIISDIQYRSSARYTYATAAYHAAACGIGHWRIKTKYVDDATFDQELALELIPYPLAVYWDPAAMKPDRSDAMWCIVVDLVPRKTFKLKFPKAQEVSVAELRANNFASGLFWQTQDYILVAEYWCKRPVDKTLLAFEDGEVYDATGLDFMALAQLQQTHGQVVAQRKAQGYRVEQALVTGAEVLNGPVAWPGAYIPIVPVIGTEVPIERVTVRHGLIRHARDAQQLYNYYRSASAEAIALAPKSPYLVTDHMIAKHKGDWQTLSSSNRSFLRYTPDPDAPNGKPERVHPPEPPAALWQEAQIATEDLKATTGIYDASLGAKSNETSGVAIKRREAQGDTANFHYQDNLVLSLEHTGRILIDLIPKIYDNDRMVRMMGDDGVQQFVRINHVLYAEDGAPVLVNDLSSARFDIRVTVGPNHTTKRLEAAEAMIELMHALPPEMAARLAPVAVRNMDIPDSQEVSAILAQSLPPPMGMPMPPPGGPVAPPGAMQPPGPMLPPGMMPSGMPPA